MDLTTIPWLAPGSKVNIYGRDLKGGSVEVVSRTKTRVVTDNGWRRVNWYWSEATDDLRIVKARDFDKAYTLRED